MFETSISIRVYESGTCDLAGKGKAWRINDRKDGIMNGEKTKDEEGKSLMEGEIIYETRKRESRE